MSITNRTLAQAIDESALFAVLDSATGTFTGATILIGTEFMTQTGPAAGAQIPIRRGQLGSAALSHAATDAVEVGLSTDFTISPILAGVFHDTTLTGTGTAGDPLSVVSGAGLGTVTNTGTLTANTVILGNGGVDVKSTTTGTGVVTALGVAVGSAGAVVVNGGALGTPSSGTLTNAAGLPEGGLSLSDVTTNNSSVSQHGFLKKLSGVSTDFMNGAGNWATPAGGGGGTTLTVLTSDPTPADDIAWIVRSGVASGDSITLKCQVNGVIYELAGVTIQ